MIRVLLILAFLTSSSCFLRVSLAEDKSSPLIQEQLDDLKHGQERILQELQSIRAALQEKPARSEQAAHPTPPVVLNVHGEPFKGLSNAPVAIVEFSDFDCSHCAEFATKTFPQLNEKYIATGKLKYFFRDLPEPGNAESLLKARFARCAGEQGKFWETHDYLFAVKPSLVGKPLEYECETLGLDQGALATCLKQEKYSIMIQRAGTGAARMGIQGTPAFIIGRLTDGGDILRINQILLGTENLAAFAKILDELFDSSDQKPADPGATNKKPPG